MKELFPGCYAMGMDELISRAAMLPPDSDHIADILAVQPMPEAPRAVEDQGPLPPIRNLTCAVCGSISRGRQWWTRDKGFGFCPRCADKLEDRMTREELTECYGVRGIHYCVIEA
jgi:hypothetical protein